MSKLQRPLAWAMRLIEHSLDELDVHIKTPPVGAVLSLEESRMIQFALETKRCLRL